MIEVALILGVLLVLGVVGLIGLAVWIAVSMVRLLLGVVFGLIGGTLRLLFRPIVGPRRFVVSERCCPRPSCQQGNPMQARFCRRCGRALTTATQPAAIADVGLPPLAVRTPSGSFLR